MLVSANKINNNKADVDVHGALVDAHGIHGSVFKQAPVK